jgi:hypothetical protein
MLLKLVTAINALNSQAWAAFMIVCGITAIVLFHTRGIEAGVGGGIIGAGVNMFTASVKQAQPTVPEPTIPNAPK